MFATDCAYHWPPRAVAMPRALSASAISRSVRAPAFWGLADDDEHVGRAAIRFGPHGRGVPDLAMRPIRSSPRSWSGAPEPPDEEGVQRTVAKSSPE